jgi:hypothetical protein
MLSTRKNLQNGKLPTQHGRLQYSFIPMPQADKTMRKKKKKQ